MAENNKQPQLIGAFYGPSIPPPSQPRRRHHHHRTRTRCRRLFSIFWKLLLAIITLILLAFIVFFLIVQPRPFKFYVTNANLTQFNFTNNTTLHYNLVLNFTAHNPNKKLGIYYDKIEGNAFYQGTRFATIDVITWRNSIRQNTKSTDRMSGVFMGQKVFVLDQGQRSGFDQDKRSGYFDIYLKLYFTIRFRLVDFIGHGSKARAECEVKVPLMSGSNEKLVATFEPAACDVKF